MVLPVKLSVSGASHLAHTCDLTSLGARLGGLHTELKMGEIVSLQRGPKKADFKVVWIQQLGSNEIHVGLQAVAKQNNFWGVDLTQSEREAKCTADAQAASAGKKS